MNIAVINLKDIIKYLISFILVFAILWLSISALNKEEFESELEKTEKGFIFSLKNSSFLYCLKKELPLITIYDEKKEKEIGKTSEIILNTQLAIINNLSVHEDIEGALVDNTEGSEFSQNTENKENQERDSISSTQEDINNRIPKTAHTEVISENNINARYTNTVNTVQINNQTSFNLDDIIYNSNYELTNKNKVIIYHTHTCESYTSSDDYNYEMTGVYRTTDLNYTVSRVGDELENLLTSYGKTVVHDKTYHDYPAYNGSYGRSLKTMEAVLEDNRDAEITIDLHRDAVRK